MYRIVYLVVFFTVISVITNSCKAPNLTQGKAVNPLPVMYNVQADSNNNVAAIPWQEYFKDSIVVSLIDTALENNLDLLIAMQRVKMARAEVRARKGQLLPEVGGMAWALQEKTGEYSVNWAGNEGGTYASGDPLRPTYNDFYLGFQSSWEVDVWGKLRNKKKAAFSRYLGSIEGTNWVITNLIAEVANTYYNLQALDYQLEIIRETIVLWESALSIVKTQKHAGSANELAVKQFEAQLLNSHDFEKELQQEVIELENRLNYLLGRFPQKVARTPGLLEDTVSVISDAGIPSHLLEHRPDIREAEFELVATKADVKSAKAAFYPSVNITGFTGFNAFDPQYLFLSPESIAYGLLGGLTAPLVNRSAVKANFEEANARQLEALYNYQETILNAYMEVSNQMASIKNLGVRFIIKSEEVDVLTQSIETSTELFKTGRATYLEVLLTQQNALQAKLELIDIKREQYHARIDIYKALGGGWRP